MVSLCLYLFCLMISVISQRTIEYASITPSTSQNTPGILTNILLPDEVTTTSNEWQISVQQQENFHVKLSLNEKWKFDPFIASEIQIQINSNSILPLIDDIDDYDLDLILSFTTPELSSYFTVILRMDNNNNNWIYPLCDPSIPPTNPMASGNIIDIINTPNTNSRFINAANGDFESYHSLNPSNYNNFLNQFPLIFTIYNNPIDDYILFKYSNPSTSIIQSCGFSPSFNVSSSRSSSPGFDILISADNNNEKFNITSFDITYSMNGTYSPTVSPTNSPTTSITDTIYHTNINMNNDNQNILNKVFVYLQNKTILYLIVIPSICVCLICFFCCLLSLKSRRNKRRKFNLSSAITGVMDYNTEQNKNNNTNTNQNHLNLNQEIPPVPSKSPRSIRISHLKLKQQLNGNQKFIAKQKLYTAADNSSSSTSIFNNNSDIANSERSSDSENSLSAQMKIAKQQYYDNNGIDNDNGININMQLELNTNDDTNLKTGTESVISKEAINTNQAHEVNESIKSIQSLQSDDFIISDDSDCDGNDVDKFGLDSDNNDNDDDDGDDAGDASDAATECYDSDHHNEIEGSPEIIIIEEPPEEEKVPELKLNINKKLSKLKIGKFDNMRIPQLSSYNKVSSASPMSPMKKMVFESMSKSPRAKTRSNRMIRSSSDNLATPSKSPRIRWDLNKSDELKENDEVETIKFSFNDGFKSNLSSIPRSPRKKIKRPQRPSSAKSALSRKPKLNTNNNLSSLYSPRALPQPLRSTKSPKPYRTIEINDIKIEPISPPTNGETKRKSKSSIIAEKKRNSRHKSKRTSFNTTLGNAANDDNELLDDVILEMDDDNSSSMETPSPSASPEPQQSI